MDIWLLKQIKNAHNRLLLDVYSNSNGGILKLKRENWYFRIHQKVVVQDFIIAKVGKNNKSQLKDFFFCK